MAEGLRDRRAQRRIAAFHHNGEGAKDKARSRFEMIRQHVLLRSADNLIQASRLGHESLDRERLAAILRLIPDAWLMSDTDTVTATEHRASYIEFLLDRLAHSTIFEEEIRDAYNDI